MHRMTSLSMAYPMPIEFSVRLLTLSWILWEKSDHLLFVLQSTSYS